MSGRTGRQMSLSWGHALLLLWSKVGSVLLVPKAKWTGPCFTLFVLERRQHANFPRARESFPALSSKRNLSGLNFGNWEQCMEIVLKNIFTANLNNGFHGLGSYSIRDSMSIEDKSTNINQVTVILQRTNV